MDLDAARYLLAELANHGRTPVGIQAAARAALDRLNVIDRRAEQVRDGFLDPHLSWSPAEVVAFMLAEATGDQPGGSPG